MRLLILVLLTAVLAGPPEAESCGPFFSFAQFSYVATPPQDVFARGQLGILRPRYYRRYLVVAFRYLNGALARIWIFDAEEKTFRLQASEGPVAEAEKPSEKGLAKVTDLMSLLKQSVERASSEKPRRSQRTG